MGQPAIRVMCHEDQESESQPGQKCIVSDSLEEFITFDTFLDELIRRLRSPLLPMEEKVLKSLDVVDHSESDFTVKVTNDGKKLDSWGIGKGDGSDVIRLWQRSRVAREARIIQSETYSDDGAVELMNTTVFLENPLRIEFWFEKPDGTRVHDETAKNMLQYFFINPIILAAMKRKVIVSPDVESPSGGGAQSAVTGELDDFLSYDEAFDGIMKAIKDVYRTGTVEEVTPTEYLLTSSAIANPLAQKDSAGMDQEFVMRQRCTHSRSKGEIVLVSMIGNELLNTSFIYFHQNPLRIEHWDEDGGTRHHGRAQAAQMQGWVDAIIEGTENQGWFY